MKIAYIVGEKIFEDKEEAQIYEQKENQYNEIIEKYLFDKWQKEQIIKELTDEIGGETSDTEES